MRSMTWKELAEKVNEMTDEQKNTDVTVYLGEMDEFFPIECRTRVATDGFDDPGQGVLDVGHPFIVINA